MLEIMHDKFSLPEWFKTWVTVIGVVSMVVSGLYLISGIFLLMINKFAINVFYIAVVISIVWAALQAVIYSQTESGLLTTQIPDFVASIVIDMVLLIVALIGSKDAFMQQREI